RAHGVSAGSTSPWSRSFRSRPGWRWQRTSSLERRRPTMTDLPMFERATRRAVLKRGLAAGGLLTSGAWLAACGGGNHDQSVFSSTPLDAAAPTAPPSTSTEFAAVAGNVTSTQADAVSGATRAAGAYNLQWDGKGLDGKPLAGDHTLWIEAAREHGPHSVMSGPIVLGQPATTTIKGMGELS